MINLTKNQEALLTIFFDLLDKRSKSEYRNKIPKSMHIPSQNHLPSFKWKLITNHKLKESDFNPYEKKLGCKLPKIYKAWLLKAHTFPIKIGGIEIFGNHPIHPMSELNEILNEEISTRNLFPIGKDLWSLWPIVFDFNSDQINPPLKLFTPTSKFRKCKLNDQIVFSSFDKLLECWIYEFGEAAQNNIWAERMYEEFALIDPPSKPHWDDVIGEIELWNDMDP